MKSSFPRVFPAILILLALVPMPAAWAEEDPLEPPDLERYLRWGPVRVRPGLQLSDVGYEDNVFFSSVNEQGDFRAALSPRIEGLVLFGDRAFLTFDERLKYTAYREFSELNYLDHRGRARLTVPLGDYGVFTSLRLSRTHDRPVDQDDIRPIRNLTELGVGGIAKLGWRTDLELARVHSDWRNRDDDFSGADVDIAQLLDRVERQNRLSIRYRLFGRTRLTLSMSNRSIRFDTPALLREPGLSRNSRETRLVPGVYFSSGGPLTGTLQLGWARLEHDVNDPALPDFSGLVGEAELAYRLGGNTTLKLSGERRVDFSVYEGNNYYTWDRYEFSGLRYLNRLLGVDASVARGELSIPGADNRLDDIFEYGAGVRFRLAETSIGRRLEYSFGVRRLNRDSTVPLFDRDRTLVSVGAVVGY